MTRLCLRPVKEGPACRTDIPLSSVARCWIWSRPGGRHRGGGPACWWALIESMRHDTGKHVMLLEVVKNFDRVTVVVHTATPAPPVRGSTAPTRGWPGIGHRITCRPDDNPYRRLHLSEQYGELCIWDILQLRPDHHRSPRLGDQAGEPRAPHLSETSSNPDPYRKPRSFREPFADILTLRQ
jgi:hypothetical protein